MPALNTEYDLTDDNIDKAIYIKKPKSKIPLSKDEKEKLRKQYNKEYYEKNKERWKNGKYNEVLNRKKICPVCNGIYINGNKKQHNNTKFHQKAEEKCILEDSININKILEKLSTIEFVEDLIN